MKCPHDYADPSWCGRCLMIPITPQPPEPAEKLPGVADVVKCHELLEEQAMRQRNEWIDRAFKCQEKLKAIERALDEKDAQLKGKDVCIDNYSRSCGEKDAEIAQLKIKIASLSSNERSADEIFESAKRLRDSYEEQVVGLKKELAEATTKLDWNRKAADATVRLVEELEKQINRRDKLHQEEISIYRSNVNGLREEIEMLKAALAEKEITLKNRLQELDFWMPYAQKKEKECAAYRILAVGYARSWYVEKDSQLRADDRLFHEIDVEAQRIVDRTPTSKESPEKRCRHGNLEYVGFASCAQCPPNVGTNK